MIDLNRIPNCLFKEVRKELGDGKILPEPRTIRTALFRMQLETMKYVSEQQQNHCFLYGLKTQRTMMVDLLTKDFLHIVDFFCSSAFTKDNMFESDPWIFYRSKAYRIGWQRERIRSSADSLFIINSVLEEYIYEEQTAWLI